MTRTRIRPAVLIPSAAGALFVALWPATVAFSTPPMTQKQAALQGVTVTRKVQEQLVDKLIVRMRGSNSSLAQPMSASRVQALSAKAGVAMKSLRTIAGGSQLLQLDRPMTVAEARAIAARLALEADVAYAEPNTWFKKQAMPNEPRFTQWQWNLFAPTSNYTGQVVNGNPPTVTTFALGGANLPTAWDLTIGTNAVTVAIVDTGIANHLDLTGAGNGAIYVPSGRFLPGYDFISPNSLTGAPADFVANDGNGRDADPSDPGDWITVADKTNYPDCRDPGEMAPYTAVDSSWHGTHMAGIAAATANNSIGIAGIAWNVRILPVRALGRCGGDLADIADAIRWAAGLAVMNVPNNPNPAQIISLSLGGGDTCSPEMQSAVDAAIAAGSTIVAASGNGGGVDALISPANCNGVVAVTAHTIDGENADYANVDARVTLSAPGGGSPIALGRSTPTDNPNFDGYYIHSAVLFGPTTPTSTDSSGRSGSAYAGFTGTSAATPHVAGVAALIKSAYPAATPGQISSFLTSTVRPYPAGSACEVGVGIFDGKCGAGLLDARLAVAAVGVEGIPMANAGPDQFVAPGSTVTLTGSGTAFPTKTINAYAWSQTSGTNVTLGGANTATATFTAPATGSMVFRLTVTDNQAKSGDDLVVVRVNNVPVLGAAPAAQSAVVGAVVAFTVTATDADNDPLTFSAASQSTVPVTALSPSGQFSWNTAGVAPGTYQLVYFATDGFGNSAQQTVAITLTNPSSAVLPSGGGGGGGGALPDWQLLLLGALLLASAIRQRKQ